MTNKQNFCFIIAFHNFATLENRLTYQCPSSWPVIITMKKKLAGTWKKIEDIDRSKNGNKFATSQILRKPVEVVKGRILAGWAQKSPELWPSTKEDHWDPWMGLGRWTVRMCHAATTRALFALRSVSVKRLPDTGSEVNNRESWLGKALWWGDFWTQAVDILVFASPTGCMLTSSGFPLLNWGIFYKFL
jgi:hypothetical protein